MRGCLFTLALGAVVMTAGDGLLLTGELTFGLLG